jgi:hypothetical protein
MKLIVLSILFVFTLILNVQAQIQTGRSILRDTPKRVGEEGARVDAVISKAETFFREAEVHLRDRDFAKAREKFDKSVETIVMSGFRFVLFLNCRNITPN